jgi:hypothetical protein
MVSLASDIRELYPKVTWFQQAHKIPKTRYTYLGASGRGPFWQIYSCQSLSTIQYER